MEVIWRIITFDFIIATLYGKQGNISNLKALPNSLPKFSHYDATVYGKNNGFNSAVYTKKGKKLSFIALVLLRIILTP